MSAFNQDAGRHANATRVAEAMAEDTRTPATGVRTTTSARPKETAEQAEARKAAMAQATGTRRSLWR